MLLPLPSSVVALALCTIHLRYIEGIEAPFGAVWDLEAFSGM